MTIVISGTNGITDVNGTAAAPAITGTDTDSGMYFGTNIVALATGGTNAVYINASQAVGIGTTSPVTVSGYGVTTVNGTTGGLLYFQNGGTTNSQFAGTSTFTGIASTIATPILFSPNNTEAVRISSAGDVGIGTNSPSVKLDVVGTISTSAIYTSNRANAASYTSGSSLELKIDGTTYAAIRQPAAEVLAFYRGSGGTTETIRIDSSGNLLVGTLTASGKFTIQCANAASAIVTGNASGTASYNGALFYNNGLTSLVGQISISGSTALYLSISDQRLKENIQDADSASALVDSLQVRQFDWKSDNTHQRYGFIAQELVTVAPEAVHQPTDSEQMMAVDYSKLVPILVKAHQEQQALITTLTARIEALEAR